MISDEVLAILRNPERPGEALSLEGKCVIGAESGRRFPIRASGMVDFVEPEGAPPPPAPPRPEGLMFKLGELYNSRFEQAIAQSVFAGGGVGALFARRRMRRWLGTLDGLVVDVGSGAEQWRPFLPASARYVSLDYLPVSAVSPWRVAFPDINADALSMPVRDGTADAAINAFVIEHVKDPRRLIEELGRIIKPGGTLVLAGPGDLMMTHGEPYHFFNFTKYGYLMMLEENGFEAVEEYIPARFWVTALGVAYQNLVRNNAYNRSAFHKLLQVPVFLVSLVLAPIVNALALLLDLVMPWDERGYSLFMVLARKKSRDRPGN